MESPIHSSPRSNIDSLIESVQARNMASTSIRLGNKLAKPLAMEQSPSSIFTFAAKKPTILENRSSQEKRKMQEERDIESSIILDTGHRMPMTEITPQHMKGTPALPELKDIPATSVEDPISITKKTLPQPAALTDLKPSNLVTGSKITQLNPLRMSPSSVDTSTLMKILAFTYHQEAKLQNKLLDDLKTKHSHLIQELSATEAHCRALEQSMKELQDQLDCLRAEKDSLEQQLQQDVRQDTSLENMIEHQFTTVHEKLDVVSQKIHKEHTESLELGKALGVIRQMADELRQYRSQAQKVSPQKKAAVSADQGIQTDPDRPAIIFKSQSPGQDTDFGLHLVDNTAKQLLNKQQSEVHENVVSDQKDTQDTQRPPQNEGDAEREESSLQNNAEQQQNDAPLGRRVNKFGKRTLTDTYSECSQVSEGKKSKKAGLTFKSSRGPAGV